MVDRVVQQRLRDNSQARNWIYRFDADAENNCFRERNRVPELYHPYHRAIHMDDLCYLFKPSFLAPPIHGTQSYELVQYMVI